MTATMNKQGLQGVHDSLKGVNGKVCAGQSAHDFPGSKRKHTQRCASSQ